MYLDGEKASTPSSRTWMDPHRRELVVTYDTPMFVLHMKSIFSCLKVVFESE